MGVRPDTEAELLSAGARLLCEKAVDGIAWLFRPEALAAATSHGAGRRVSRPTAARLWSDRTSAVVDVALHVNDAQRNGADAGTREVAKTYHPVLAGDDTSCAEKKDALRNVLRQTLDRQLRSPHIPTGWVLHAAALTSSPVWEGDRPSDELRRVGEQILVARSALNQEVRRHWTALLRDTLKTYKRRPRRGVTPEKIADVMQSMFNGFLLQLVITPELNDPGMSKAERDRRLDWELELLAEAMWTVTWTYTTTPEVLEDPRRPADPERARLFERLVEGAARTYLGHQLPLPWTGQEHVIEPAVAARCAGVPDAVAREMFPHAADLADSVLRLVAAPGSDIGQALVETPLAAVKDALRRLREAAMTHPLVVEVARRDAPTHPADATGFLDELIEVLGDALGSSRIRAHPVGTARTLVELALAGDAGWRGIEALLGALDVLDADGGGPG